MFLELRHDCIVAYGVKKALGLKMSVFLYFALMRGEKIEYQERGS